MKRFLFTAIFCLSGFLTTNANADSLGTITFSEHGSAHQWTAPDSNFQLSDTWTLDKAIKTTTPPTADILAPNANVGDGNAWTLDFTLINQTGVSQAIAGLSFEAVTFNNAGAAQPNPRNVTFTLSYQIDGGEMINWGALSNDITGGNWQNATSVYNFTMPDSSPLLLTDGQSITFHVTPSCAQGGPGKGYGTFVGLKSIGVEGGQLVPEPATASLGLLALSTLLLRRRTRREA